MKCFFLLAAVLFGPVLAAEVATILDDKTFEHQTQASTGQTTGKWFVKFYAPWCGHCKKLAPTWDELADKLATEKPGDGIVVAKVDCTKNKELGQRFKIRGYPTLLYFAERKMFRYSGARDLDSFAEFAAGGYKDADGEEVPAPPSWIDQKMKELRQFADSNEFIRVTADDFEHIISMRKNAASVMILMGLLLGLILGCFVGSMGRSKSKAKKD